MKPLKQILSESDTLKVRENINSKELVEMVELGLLEKEKLSLLERALTIDAELMTEAEKGVILDLLNSLIAERSSVFKSISNQNPYSYSSTSTGDTQQSNYSSDSKIPVIITFKRRSIRVFPNSVKIALYYSPQLDKYISIPFGGADSETLGTTISEAVNTKAQNTYQKTDPRAAFQSSVDTNKNLDDQDKSVAKSTHDKVGKGAAKDFVTNTERAVSNAKKRAALERTRGAWQQAKYKGGHREGLDRIDRNIGDPIANAAAKATHLVKYAGSKAIQGALKLAGHSVKEETADETFARNLAEARVKRFKPKKASVVKYKARRSPKKATRKTKKLGSWHSPFKKTRIKSHKIKVAKPKKTVAKKATTPVSTPRTSTVASHLKSYIKARRSYNNATSRPVTVWDNEKRQKVTVDAKDHYKKLFKHHAAAIRANGGTLPVIAPRKKPKRTPGIKPPPALAEGQMDEGAWELAKRAWNWITNSRSTTSKQYTDKKSEEDGNNQNSKFTAKRKGDTVGTGTVVGSNRVTDDASRAKATERTYGKKKTTGIDVTNEERLSNLELIRTLAESEGTKTDVYFDGNTITINSRIARKVLAIYESLNKANQRSMEKMLNESVSSFRKVINFTIRQ